MKWLQILGILVDIFQKIQHCILLYKRFFGPGLLGNNRNGLDDSGE